MLLILAVTGCMATPAGDPGVNGIASTGAVATTKYQGEVTTLGHIIPKPVLAKAANSVFELAITSRIVVEPGIPALKAIAEYLAGKLRPATGFELPVISSAASEGDILLTTAGGDPDLGAEGYELSIQPGSVSLVAPQPAGVFYGVQTIRQLLPAEIERSQLQPGPWRMAAGLVRDYPRYSWRGVMLDVSRHFFSVEDVKRYIDLIVYYKMNRFHLHLSDDQGWRIAIKSWPLLAAYGGNTQVGGGAGGYYTQEQYAEIVAYAQSQYVTIVPEIDMPGHTNAALASYAELNCNGIAPRLYTGIEVGFSSLCTDKGVTYGFISDVLGELAALTPGPYLHIGGDEASATPKDAYINFIERVQNIVQGLGKQMIGWEEIAQAELLPSTIAQHWHSDLAHQAVRQGAKVVLSPAAKVYLDMKYDAKTPLGLDWAGTVDLPTAYNWDPANQVAGIAEGDILGVEAPLWSETLLTMDDIEFMAFPRLPGIAEIGWSPAQGRNWEEYRLRLGEHGARLQALNVNYYPSPQVPWR